MATMNVSLPSLMRDWINDRVGSGEYANASDYVRDLIRHDQQKLDALRLAVREGLDSGESLRKADDIMAAAKSRLKDG